MGLDKKLHLACGFIICVIVSFFFGKQYGVAAAIVIGVLKELYDYFNPQNHSVEFLDFLATCVGGILAYIIL